MPGSKIKVAWLCTPFGLTGRGGTLRHLTNWAKHMDWDQLDVILILGGPDPGQLTAARQHFETARYLRIVYLDGLNPVSRWFRGGLWQLRECLQTFAPDIVHTIFIQSDIAGGLVRQKARVPVHISSLEGALVPGSAPLVKRYLYKLGYARIRDQLDAIIGISQATGEDAVRDFGAPADRIHVIHSGVDLQEFQFKSGWPYSFAPPAKVVGMISRLYSEKIPHLLVEAAPRVLQRYSEARFVVAGSGPEEQRLKSLARELGVLERFEFVGWTDRVAHILHTFDVFVFTSRFEGLPWAVLEAQAVGVPTVASAVGGVPEVIQDGQNGLLLRRDTPEELAEKILWMLEHRERAAEMGRVGRRAVETHFNIQREVSDIQSLYERLCSASRRLDTQQTANVEFRIA